MTTLFDIGDEIELTIRGKIKRYSIDKPDDDCWVVEIPSSKDRNDYSTDLYFSSKSLKNAKIIKKSLVEKYDKKLDEMQHHV